MLPGSACGIDFNITEIKIILFWNICKLSWFHTGISHPCLSLPKLNTFHKSSGWKSWDMPFLLFSLESSLASLEISTLSRAVGLGEPQPVGTEGSAAPHRDTASAQSSQYSKECAPTSRELEYESMDLILVQERQVRHANCIWLMSWLSDNEQVTNFYMDSGVKDFIQTLSRLLVPLQES